MAGVAASDVADAVTEGTEFFMDRQTRAGVLARRLVGKPAARDAVLVDHLVRERRHRTRMDGSVDGSLIQTAWAVLELLQLDCPPDHAGVVRMMGWVLSRQSQPGHFGEGCSPERHGRGLCQHSLAGFFSPGAVGVPSGPARFPSGVTIHDEAEARFAASCFALRAALRAGQDQRRAVRDHVESLLNLGEMWGGWDGPWHPDLVLFALGGVAQGPLEVRDRVDRLAARVCALQHADGSWPGADVIHVLDVLLLVPTPAARAAVRDAAPALVALAREGMLFQDPAGEERSLIALRALRAAA